MAFGEVQLLCSALVLCNRDLAKEFILMTGTLELGLGAVISQEFQAGEHPILYLSWKLLPQEQKYAVIEKEHLAIKWAVEALHYYLLGAWFHLVTGHVPLTWLNAM